MYQDLLPFDKATWRSTIDLSMQVIRRSGKWLYASLIKSYLDFFKAVGLLGCGGWPGAATNELHMFWHERFMIPAPQELVLLLFPFLPNLEKAINELGAAASLSMHAAPLILLYLAKVVIQDAAGGMSQMHPDHDVHVLLNTSPVFRFAASALVMSMPCSVHASWMHFPYKHCMPISTLGHAPRAGPARPQPVTLLKMVYLTLLVAIA